MERKPKYRHELKYEIAYAEYLQLYSRLKNVMQADPHASHCGKYKITSLYFDNFYDKALREKIDGISVRDKFRIRFYNDDFSFIILEKKSKRNSLCLKKSCSITKEECKKILAEDIEWAKNSDRELLREFYNCCETLLLKPKTIVSYDRMPLIYAPGNVRVTFDMNIRSGLYNTDLFDVNQPLAEVLKNKIILEVKYDEFMPDIIKTLLQIGIPRVQAFSKYAACRKYE